MTFEYLQRVIVDAQIDIENIGDCAVLGRNDVGEEFYIIIKTELGWTELLEYGPIVPDFDLLPYNYNITYSRIEYNQTKIERAIDKFLNNPKRVISQAEVVNVNDIRHLLINPIDKVLPPSLKGDLFDE